MTGSKTRRAYLREQTSRGGWIPPLVLAMLLGGSAFYYSRKAGDSLDERPRKPVSAVTLAVANSDESISTGESAKKTVKSLLTGSWRVGKSEENPIQPNSRNREQLLEDDHLAPANALTDSARQEVADRVAQAADGVDPKVDGVRQAQEGDTRPTSSAIESPSDNALPVESSPAVRPLDSPPANGLQPLTPNSSSPPQNQSPPPSAPSTPPLSSISPLLNRPAGRFSFVDLESRDVLSHRFQDKVAVLVWFNNHPTSRATLNQLESVHRKYQGRSDVEVLAVCVEPTDRMSHEDVSQLLRSWSVGIPAVRDLKACGRDVFQVTQAPTLVALGKDGTVQIVEVGAGPEMEQQLPTIIDRLLTGENLAAAYLDHLAQAGSPAHRPEVLAAEPPPTEFDPRSSSLPSPQTERVQSNTDEPQLAFARRSEPARFRMTKLWQFTDMRHPGNLLVVPDLAAGNGRLGEKRTSQLLVHDGGQQVVRLNVEGQLVDRHRLAIEKGDAITALDAAVDGDGRRYYAGTAKTAGRVYVWDANFQLLFRYPVATVPTGVTGIHDARLVDLDRDGHLELYVGFDGQEGLHRVDLRGNTVWKKAEISPVLSLAVVAREGQYNLLVTGVHGRIIPVDPLGRDGQPIQVGQRTIHRIWPSSAATTRPTVFCGTVNAEIGATTAIGLSPQLNEMWSYRLPEGQYASQVRPVTTARLTVDDACHWIMAGPDGSVHIVSDDGLLNDEFYYGESITGIAAVNTDRGPLLFIATPSELAAWSLSVQHLGTAQRPR